MLGPGRTRPGRGKVGAALAVVALIVAACGSGEGPKAVEEATGIGPLTAPPTLPQPAQLPVLATEDVPSGASEPTPGPAATVPYVEPRVIPSDSYAEEPVTELGRMTIPKIGLEHRIFQGVTLNNIDHGPSHWPGTALPGQRGNTVFAAHRTTRTHPFRRIDELEAGDEVIFRVAGLRSTYKVTGSEVVVPEAVWIADQTADATGTLYACHPPGYATYRYVVRLALTSVSPDV